MRKWTIVAGFLFSILALVSFYLFFIYPNDERVPNQAFGQKQGLPRTLTGSMFDASPHEHRLSVNPEQYKRQLEELRNHPVVKRTVGTSARFGSPYQTYFSVGRYPDRLHGFDGIYLASGVKLYMAGPPSEEFEFQVYMFDQDGELSVTLPTGPKTFAVKAIPGHVDKLSKWRRVRTPAQDFEALVPDRVVVGDVLGQALSIECSRPCIISNPLFLDPSQSQQRNLLVIMVDTLRYDAINQADAPHIHSLFAESTQFKKAIAPGNMTSPSTNAFLNCQHPTNVGEMAFKYSINDRARQEFYRSRKPSWPELLRRKGMRTKMIGNVSVLSEVMGVGVDHGFSEQIAIEPADYETPLTAREARRFLAENRMSPFYLYVHFNSPHAPYKAPLKYLTKTFPGTGVFENYPTILRWIYRAEIAFVDRYVGEILAALKEQGLDQKTDIVLTSDHGDQHKPHDYPGHLAGPGKTGSYFDHGATLLNDEVMVPLALRLAEESSRVDDHRWVSTLDIGPTLLERFGLAVPEYCSGTSLVGDEKERLIISEGFRARSILFDNRYKYVKRYAATHKRFYTPDSWSGVKQSIFVPERLYDLKDDPDERNNLIGIDHDLAQKSRRKYRELFNETHEFELVLEKKGTFHFIGDFKGEPKLVEGVAATETSFVGAAMDRQIIPFSSLESVPSVKIDGDPVSVAASRMRLPLNVPIHEYPLEIPGPHSLFPPKADVNAYLRKVAKTNIRERKVVATNPEFEKVLKEWGYLNDN